jgi:inosine/xanthosine triphosphate pyrophosphatase family protein
VGEGRQRICANKMYKFSHLLNKVGMLNKKSVAKPLSVEELQLIEQLREHPELVARFQSIIGITRNEGTALKTADEVEGLLIEELRRLGHAGLSQWAVRAEERVSQELRAREPQARSRKKKR